MLVRVVTPVHAKTPFVAGFVTDESGKCIEAAPILRRHILGKSREQIREILARNGWRASIVKEYGR